VRAVGEGDARRSPGDFLHGDDVREIAEPDAAVLLLGGDAEQAHATQLAPQIGGKQVVAIDGFGARRNFVSGKGLNAGPQHVDGFAMGKIEARVFHVSRSLIRV
jgi:hypothetical protein